MSSPETTSSASTSFNYDVPQLLSKMSRSIIKSQRKEIELGQDYKFYEDIGDSFIVSINHLTAKLPDTCPFKNGHWDVKVVIFEGYPKFSMPELVFMNKIYHPNVDESTGHVSPNLIRDCWKSHITLRNLLDDLLPTLLLYPNPLYKSNEKAAIEYMHFPKLFTKNVEASKKKIAAKYWLNILRADAREALIYALKHAIPIDMDITYEKLIQKYSGWKNKTAKESSNIKALAGQWLRSSNSDPEEDEASTSSSLSENVETH